MFRKNNPYHGKRKLFESGNIKNDILIYVPIYKTEYEFSTKMPKNTQLTRGRITFANPPLTKWTTLVVASGNRIVGEIISNSAYQYRKGTGLIIEKYAVILNYRLVELFPDVNQNNSLEVASHTKAIGVSSIVTDSAVTLDPAGAENVFSWSDFGEMDNPQLRLKKLSLQELNLRNEINALSLQFNNGVNKYQRGVEKFKNDYTDYLMKLSLFSPTSIHNNKDSLYLSPLPSEEKSVSIQQNNDTDDNSIEKYFSIKSP